MPSCDVLLMGTMGDIGDSVLASLQAHGLTVATIPFPQNTFRDEQGYRRTLFLALQEWQPQMIWPIGHPLALSRLVHEAAEGTASPHSSSPRHSSQRQQSLLSAIARTICPVATPSIIQTLDSKVQCSRLATSLGIPQPLFYARSEDVPSFPVIFKRDRSFGGSGVYRPFTLEGLQKLELNERNSERHKTCLDGRVVKLEDEVSERNSERHKTCLDGRVVKLEDEVSEQSRSYLIEEYVEGEDVSVDIVRWGSQFHAACYRTLSRRQRQGPAERRESCEAPQLVAYGRQLIEAAGFEGVCGLDFRVTPEGRICFLECNPRFTGGLATQREAGFDIPWLFYQAINLCH